MNGKFKTATIFSLSFTLIAELLQQLGFKTRVPVIEMYSFFDVASVLMPNHKYSFAYCPLIFFGIISIIIDYNNRNEQIVFGKFGITLPDGTLCKLENIRLIEYKRTSFFSLSLLIYTKNHTYEENTHGYDFKFERLKGYMMLNHPDIPCDSYVIEVLDGGYDTKKEKRCKS